MKLSRRTAVVALTACCAATATAPALAADGANNVSVSLSAVGGTRQFDVLETGSTTALSALDFGATDSKAFRTRVRDENFETLSKSYSVTATMSNLYLKRGNGTHDPATKIPSGQLSLAQGALSADALTASILPKLSVGGALASCATLPADVKTALGIPVGSVDLVGALVGVTGQLATVCNALGSAGAPVAGVIDGAVKTVTTTLADVTKLPNALTAGTGRAFSDADYAHDAVAALDPDGTGAATPTGIGVMSGASALSLPTELVNALKAQLTTALAGTPLVSATDSGADTTLSRALGTITNPAVRTAVAGLSAAQQAELLSTLPVTLLDPTLATLRGLTTAYYATPTLNATRTAPVPGVYDGTLTLTFVQQ